MNGLWLLLPFLLIRFGLLAIFSREAVGRAAHFAPMAGGERAACWVYQLSNAALLLYLPFLRVRTEHALPLFVGLACYLAGLVLCAASIAGFAAPSGGGLCTKGIYRFSRNPMYVSYFLCFAGMALLVRSAALTGIVLVFQVSAHWIILAEERWCLETFGADYRRYAERVRRYL